MWSAEFGDLESIAEAGSQHHSEKVALLQMSEIATAYNISPISTPQHVFPRNFPCILNTFLYTAASERLVMCSFRPPSLIIFTKKCKKLIRKTCSRNCKLSVKRVLTLKLSFKEAWCKLRKGAMSIGSSI